MDIRKIATESAALYFQYATEKKRSLSRTPVQAIEREGSAFILTLLYPVASIDGMQLQVGEVLFDEDSFHILNYNRETRTLKLIAQDDLEQLLLENSASVALAFDLRFLIRKVREWYEQYGLLIRLPKVLPQLTSPSLTNKTVCPSNDQMAAIQGIFSSPLTYVWGAPGTGKTQLVLAQSILNYIRKGKRVLITAPTNRAIEQILYGILPILEQDGIQSDLSLRLGTPTREFAQKYPSICENHSLEVRLSATEEEIHQYEQQFIQNQRQLERYEEYLNFSEKAAPYLFAAESIYTYFDLLKEAETQQKSAEALQSKATEEQPNYSSAAYDTAKKFKKQTALLHRTERKLHRTEISPFFHKNYEKVKLQYEITLQTYQTASKEKDRADTLYRKNCHDLKQAKEQIEAAQAQIQRCRTEIWEKAKLFPSYRPLLALSYTCDDVDYQNLNSDARPSFEKRIQSKLNYYEREKQRFSDIANLDIKQLRAQTAALQEKLNNLKESRSKLKKQHRVRMDQCKLLATTLDLALIRLKPDGEFLPDHIFLDEAGYAPLIKAAPLTAFRCPLTLLGDHMQLPPVCEMNEDEIKCPENAPIALWTQSALYLEDLFLQEYDALYQRFINHESPFFHHIKKFDLLHSYRFGSKLANVLAGEVYSTALTGNDKIQTELFFIDAPCNSKQDPTALKRRNLAECDAVAAYVAAHPDEEIGIITPYRNQKEALRHKLFANMDINTIHSAQGREWDCVILSVVDTTDRFFTDSNLKISNGKKIINTAVSRAKKKLIIVCDANYWSSQKTQLIGKILSISKEIE